MLWKLALKARALAVRRTETGGLVLIVAVPVAARTLLIRIALGRCPLVDFWIFVSNHVVQGVAGRVRIRLLQHPQAALGDRHAGGRR